MSESHRAGAGEIDVAFWRARRVLVTGHTGFKGAWLCLWLQSLGACVSGFSRGAPTQPSLYELARVADGMEVVREGDVREFEAVQAAVRAARPEVVFHLAAQPLVRRSYAAPRETYAVNVMGTVHLLDAVRAAPDVRAVVCVTSDKCYENRAVGDATPRRSRLAGELAGAGFREDARLGGDDPYASSKAAAELAVEAYRRSFFAGSVAGGADAPRVASARAGNVIGGGDWGKDRLVPDLMRAALSGQPVRVRNPDAVRPWQHVLNPLSGYLVLAQALWEDPRCARAWNFGPPPRDAWPVRRVVERVSELWPGGLRWRIDERPNPPEADRLQLDSSRARERLGWRPPLDLEQALEATVEWHLQLPGGADAREATRSQIGRYVRAAGVLEESRSL